MNSFWRRTEIPPDPPKKEIKLTPFEEDWQRYRAMKRGEILGSIEEINSLANKIRGNPEFMPDMEPEL